MTRNMVCCPAFDGEASSQQPSAFAEHWGSKDQACEGCQLYVLMYHLRKASL